MPTDNEEAKKINILNIFAITYLIYRNVYRERPATLTPITAKIYCTYLAHVFSFPYLMWEQRSHTFISVLFVMLKVEKAGHLVDWFTVLCSHVLSKTIKHVVVLASNIWIFVSSGVSLGVWITGHTKLAIWRCQWMFWSTGRNICLEIISRIFNKIHNNALFIWRI